MSRFESPVQIRHGSLPFPEANGLGPSRELTEFATPPRQCSKKTRIWAKRSGRKAGYFIHKTPSAPLFSSPAAGSNFDPLDAVQDSPDPAPKVVHPYFKRGSKFSAGQQHQLRWECPHCPFVCEADTSQKICLSRHHHNELAHNGQYQVGPLCRQVAIGPVTGRNVAWNCPFCAHGLADEVTPDLKGCFLQSSCRSSSEGAS